LHTGIKLAAWAGMREAELFKTPIIAEGYAQPPSKPGLHHPAGDGRYYAASFNPKRDA